MRCVTDANIWIDLYVGGVLVQAFDLDIEWVTTDLAIEESKDDPKASVLVGLGLQVLSLPGEAVMEIPDLSRLYPGPSPEDLSLFILARDADVVLVTGDGALRKAAEAEGIEVHGVLWVLDLMAEAEAISSQQAGDALTAMLAGGARLPKGEVDRRLRRWR